MAAPIQIIVRVDYFKSILHQVHSALNWLLNACFLFVPHAFTNDLNLMTAEVRVGLSSISSTLTQAVRVYFRTIFVFICKRSCPEHAPELQVPIRRPPPC